MNIKQLSNQLTTVSAETVREAGTLVLTETKNIAEKAPQAAGKIGKWAPKNPSQAGALIAGTGLAAVTAPTLIFGSLLSAAGFGMGGIKAGSLAAGAHSAIGNVAADSVFATLQSAGALGAGVAAVNSAVQATGGIVAAAGAGIFVKSKL